MTWLGKACLGLQVVVVGFLALHDWIPLGTLNNLAGIRSVDPMGRRLVATVVSTLPFAIGLAASLYFGEAGFPTWLLWFLWLSYGMLVYGILRAWWLPYLLGADPERAARYQTRFADTHAFLPARHGIRPDTLHVLFHAVVLLFLVLLGFLTFARGPVPLR